MENEQVIIVPILNTFTFVLEILRIKNTNGSS